MNRDQSYLLDIHKFGQETLEFLQAIEPLLPVENEDPE